ncbi:MAG: tetratricopeptide repeat protein, partial [Myxococcaceae bacterium]
GGNPEEGEFYAWRGYAKFFLHEDKKVGLREAQSDLQVCLHKNERVAQAHFFLGTLMKLTGDAAGAQKYFKRTLELRPDHVDAQRELRLAAKKA